MVAYLQKSEGSEGFHQIIDFLNASHIQYALTENPTIYVSFIKQFWKTATARTSANGEVELTATIDGQVKTITEASLRRHLKLEDNGGITTLPNSEIFEQLALMGYVTDSDKLTFQKGHFSPQWKFLIHTILHCLSPKKTAWEQFSSNIATAIICLATNRTYNFSKLIFDAMIKNLENPHKFLMYPRFIQIWLNKQRRLLQPHTRTYPTPILTQKVFSNMKRVSRGYSGIDFSLFPTMISAPETSPSRITSSPSLSPQHTPVSTPSTSQPPNTQPTPDAEEAVPMPHESPLHSVHSLGRDEGSLSLSELTVLCTNLSNKVTSLEAELAQTKQTYGTALTKLIKKVKKLEQTVKSTQARRRFRIVVSDDEEGLEDPSKQGRKITEIDQDPSISLVQDEGTSWIQEDIEIQEKISDDTEVVLEEEEPTELVEDQGSGEKGEKEVSTVGAEHSTVILEVSTAAANLVYIRRSAQKRKDKGKAIMEEDESVQKKTKKQLEQERLGHEEAIRLQEQIDEEERQRIARDAEIAKQLQEEINKATQEQEKQEVVTEADPTHVIDWSDPSVIRYHALQNRAFSIPEVRKNVCMYLINQGGYKMRHFKGISYEDIRPIFEKVWDQIHSFVPMDSELEIPKLKRAEPVKRQSTEEEKKRDDSSKPAKGRRKKTLARKRASGKDSEESMKKQKLEDDTEKEDLKAYLDIIPGDDVAIDIESLSTKADGSSKTYMIFSEMLDDFDGQDTLFEPDEEDEVWRNQQEYNLISWRLYDSCGIHILLMDNGIAIHMMIEKKYPLNQEMLSRMLSKRLEVDHESTMAYELLRIDNPDHFDAFNPTSLVDVPVIAIAEPPLLSVTTTPPPPTPLIIHLQQTPVPTPTTVPSSSLQDLPNFGFLFGFDHRLKTFGKHFPQSSSNETLLQQFSQFPGNLDAYLANKMH
ncbi:hypothetical protein Tco_0576135 [Tanacetum coccineum]